MASKRPRRGPAGRNVLVTGDTGPRQPQHGAQPGATESGDLQAREFGVPQADLPGGLRHLVNTEAVPVKTPDKDRRPADYHKYHGVPSDDGQYHATPTEADIVPIPKAEPVPVVPDSVPVHIVEGPRHKHSLRKLVTSGPLAIASGTVDPVHIAVRDPNRIDFWICNETTTGGAGQATPGLRVGDYETTADGRGLFIPAAQLVRLADAQDEIYAINLSGTSITVSWGYLTEIDASGA